MEGWQFLQLSGPYRQPGSHTAVFPFFAERIEVCVRSEVDEYVTTVVQERPEQEKT
jgi:hypothetical protein